MPLFGIEFPWETAQGEGFIAPWSKVAETPAGLVEASKAPPGAPILSNEEIKAYLKAPESPMPNGITARTQEILQNMQKGNNDVPGTVNIPGVNTGQQNNPISPGQDLSAEDEPVINSGAVGGLAGLAGSGLASLLGGGAAATVAGGLGALLLSRIKFPWQTPTGEGFIAPWTNQEQLASGLWGQDAVLNAGGYNAAGTAVVPAGGAAVAAQPSGINYASLRGGVPVKVWTNAAKNGATPATVQFVMFSNGYIASQSLVDGSTSIWKPKKHIVISSNPRLSQLGKLDRTYRRVTKRVKKMRAFK